MITCRFATQISVLAVDAVAAAVFLLILINLKMKYVHSDVCRIRGLVRNPVLKPNTYDSAPNAKLASPNSTQKPHDMPSCRLSYVHMSYGTVDSGMDCIVYS